MLGLGQLVSMSYTEKPHWKKRYTISSLSKRDEGTHYVYRASVLGGYRPRLPLIEIYSDIVSPTSPCKVNCTCEYYRFKVALGLSRAGATTSIIRKEDIPATFTRGSKPGLCPHLYQLAEAILLSIKEDNNPEAKTGSVNSKLKGLT